MNKHTFALTQIPGQPQGSMMVLNDAAIDSLEQFAVGPTKDSEICSKSGRGQLYTYGLACRTAQRQFPRPTTSEYSEMQWLNSLTPLGYKTGQHCNTMARIPRRGPNGIQSFDGDLLHPSFLCVDQQIHLVTCDMDHLDLGEPWQAISLTAYVKGTGYHHTNRDALYGYFPVYTWPYMAELYIAVLQATLSAIVTRPKTITAYIQRVH